jgi:PAS domain S-box-containing protein
LPAGGARGPLDPAALPALYWTSRELARCESAEAGYDVIAAGAHALAGAAVALYVPDAAGALRLAARQGWPAEPPAQLIAPESWITDLIAHDAPAQGARWAGPGSPLAAVLGAAPGTVGLALALVGAARRHGVAVLALSCAAAPGELAALWALAEDGAQALDRIAQADAAQRGDHLGGSGRALAAVNAVTDIGLLYSNLIDQMLSAILAQIVTVLNLVGGAILIFNEQSEVLELTVATPGPAPRPEGCDVLALWQPGSLARSVAEAREAASRGQLSIASDAGDSAIAAALRSAGTGQLISVPLLAGGWLTGVLQVATARSFPVGGEALQILHILARQTAVAIENARLFAQTRNDQERTSAVVDATNDAILMLDERRRTMIVNRRARFFFGLSERDLQDKDLDQAAALFNRIFEDAARFQSWLRQLLRSATERAVDEFRIIRPEQRLLQCFSAPVMDVHDRYLGRILVFRDITREREVERMKSDFVSNVSHELRTPLTSIQGALQLVLGPPRGGRPSLADGLSQRARDLLTISLNNTERLIRLINDILDIAKIEQGRIQLRREALSPDDLCRNAAAEVGAFANNRGITIDLEIQPRMPKIFADVDRSAQILVNLLSNAIKFSSPGQRVLLSARHEGMAVCFAIRDWGRGIAPEDQGRLFQKFQQIDSSATRDVGGTGLGLAISKALVEEQGGRIWFDSALGKGSTFSFTLPVMAGVDPYAEAGAPRPLALLAGLGAAQGAVQAGLGQAGWQVQQIADTAMIPASAQASPPDVLVLALPPRADQAAALLAGLADEEALQLASVLALGDPGDGFATPRVLVLPADAGADQIVAAALAALEARQPHVLVVDDDPHVRPVLVRLLQRHGLRVTNVGDGLTALSVIEQVRPNVVLLDVKMPGIDGTEVLRRIKQNPAMASTRVIILTANDLGDSLQAQVLGQGADGYLEKPITYERLISAVTTALLSDGDAHG